MYNKEFIDDHIDWLIKNPIKEKHFASGEVIRFVTLPNRSMKTFSEEELEYFKKKSKQFSTR